MAPTRSCIEKQPKHGVMPRLKFMSDEPTKPVRSDEITVRVKPRGRHDEQTGHAGRKAGGLEQRALQVGRGRAGRNAKRESEAIPL